MTTFERQSLRQYFKGIPSPVPLWALILEAAKEDPLRAQEIEAQVNGFWWERWLVYKREQSSVASELRRQQRGRQA